MRTRNEIQKMYDALDSLKQALTANNGRLGTKEAVWHGFISEGLFDDEEFPKSRAKKLKATKEKLYELMEIFSYNEDELGEDDDAVSVVSLYLCIEWILASEDE